MAMAAPMECVSSFTPHAANAKFVNANGEFGGMRIRVTIPSVGQNPRPTSASRITRAFGFRSIASSTRREDTSLATTHPMIAPPTKPPSAATSPTVLPKTQPATTAWA